MLLAKLSTAKTVVFGPVLDTNGAEFTTAVVGDVKISKNGAAAAALDASATLTHSSVGTYLLALTANDISAVGEVTVFLSKTTYVAPPVRLNVLPALVYDSLVGGTDNLQVDTIQVGGTAQTARDLGASVLLSNGTGTGQISLSSGAVTVGTNNDKTGYTASTVSDKTGYSLTATTGLGNQTANITGNLSGSVGSVTGAVGSVTGAVGSVTAGVTIADATSDAVIADAVWNALTASYGSANTYGALIESGNVGGGAIVAASVTGAVGSVTGAVASVTGNVGGSVASVTGAVGSVTGNVGGNVTGSVGSIATGGISSGSFAAGAINAAAIAADAIGASELAADAVSEIAAAITIPTAAAVADAVWDEAIAGHLTAGSTGNALNAAGSAGDPWSTPLPGAYGAGTAGKIVGDNINAPIATVDTVVDGIATTLGVAGAGLTAIASAANLAIVDGNVDAILADTGTDGVVVAAGSKTGYALSSSGVDSVVIETGLNARQALSVIAASAAGLLAGAATATVVIKAAQEGSTTRITATVDADGNRSAITLNPPT